MCINTYIYTLSCRCATRMFNLTIFNLIIYHCVYICVYIYIHIHIYICIFIIICCTTIVFYQIDYLQLDYTQHEHM